jgi:hypothetical protein
MNIHREFQEQINALMPGVDAAHEARKPADLKEPSECIHCGVEVFGAMCCRGCYEDGQ